jgi:photosynthetic reaction center cytochrome c subunit
MNKRIRDVIRFLTAGLSVGSLVLVSGCEPGVKHSVQAGYRGLGMMQVSDKSRAAELAAANTPPPSTPAPPSPPGSPLAGATYKNVQVLKEVPVGEFARLMVAVTSWVAPKEGCLYCHDQTDLAADTKYTKVVARRMFEMTRHINADWNKHVAGTGVTCFTCHRGNTVPTEIWFTPSEIRAVYAGNHDIQTGPSPAVRLAALPNNPFSTYLDTTREIRVVAQTALRQDGMGASIQTTEKTYGLMMHFTQALGVNCTYCHNSRSFFDWDQSTPQRAVAWYGIRMVRDLNVHYLDPLAPTFPPYRHGENGDGPKLNCATCHQGAFKPLNGASMVSDYPELRGPVP